LPAFVCHFPTFSVIAPFGFFDEEEGLPAALTADFGPNEQRQKVFSEGRGPMTGVVRECTKSRRKTVLTLARAAGGNNEIQGGLNARMDRLLALVPSRATVPARVEPACEGPTWRNAWGER
jgi:hypothetical protein